METNKITTTPKDFFLHLFNIVVFYIAVVNFIIIFINYINVFFPDPLSYSYFNVASTVKTSMAILLVSVPFFILTSRMIGKDLKADPIKREMGLRKWLLYMTLFLAGITIVITLIILLNNFLGGELTIRFFLNTLWVLLVAISIFRYFMWDLKRKDQEKSKLPKKLAWILSFVLLILVVLGFLIIGTPAMQRSRELDQRKVDNLSAINMQVNDYWNREGKLPESLEELGKISFYYEVDDIDSYEYRIIDSSTFELCTTFDTSSEEMGILNLPTPNRYSGEWSHEKGRVCFIKEIEKLNLNTF